MSCDGDVRKTWLVHIKNPLSLVTKSVQSAKGIIKQAGQQRLCVPGVFSYSPMTCSSEETHFYLTFLDDFLPFICPAVFYNPYKF